MKWKGKIDFDVLPEVGGTPLNLDLLDDVIITSPTTNQVLEYNGTHWVNAAGGGGGGDVTSSANITDHALVRGDGGAKGVQQSSQWIIADDGEMVGTVSRSGWALDVVNTQATAGGAGLCVRGGETLGDIAFHVGDADDTFHILEVEADQGYVTFGKSYATTLADNSVVYGIDNQNSGSGSEDFNTQNGSYRVGGDLCMHGSLYQSTADEAISSTTSGTAVEKLTLTTPSLPSGVYRIGWTSTLKSTGDGRMHVQLDDTTTLDLHHIDSSTNDYVSMGGFYVTGTISGVHDIDIDYWAVSGTSSIQMARLEIWRIS